MKAYISYSLTDSEQYIVSVLALKLNEQNFQTDLSYFDYEGEQLSFSTRSRIKNSHLFIGILTQDGSRFNSVHKEWSYALETKTPAIILVEDTLFEFNPQLKHHPNVLGFNRAYPEATIAQVHQNIKDAALKQKGKLNNALAWMLGGVAAIALVRLLSKQEQEAA